MADCLESLIDRETETTVTLLGHEYYILLYVMFNVGEMFWFPTWKAHV